MGARWVAGVLVAVMAALGAACGGDDDGADAAAEERASGSSGELALGDPCEFVTADEVAAVIGFDVTTALINVDDDLPGATCTYTGAEGQGTINLNVTPDGESFFDASAGAAEEGPSGLGDRSYIVEGGEIGVLVDGHFLQVSVFVSSLTLEGEGVEIAELAVDAVS